MLLLLSILSLVLPAQAMEEYQTEEYHTAPRQSHHIQALENALVSVHAVRVLAAFTYVCTAQLKSLAHVLRVYIRELVYSHTAVHVHSRAPPFPTLLFSL